MMFVVSTNIVLTNLALIGLTIEELEELRGGLAALDDDGYSEPVGERLIRCSLNLVV